MKTRLYLVAAVLVVTSIFPINRVRADDESLTEAQEEQLSHFTEALGKHLDKAAFDEARGLSLMDQMGGPDVIVTPGNGSDDGYGGDPRDNPTPYPYPDVDTTGLDLPFVSRKSGAAELIASKVLYQTLMFYGVVHIIEKQGSKKTFKIVQSKSGYFKSLTSLDIAFAIRAFSLYIVGLLCNDPSQMNFARLIQQVKPEQLGLRFKYDMAWALLGNYLPREPNDMFKLGTRWKGLSQIFQTTRTLNMPAGSSGTGASSGTVAEMRNWVTSLGDVVNIVTRLNRLMCFVDVRPDPREEIKKRMLTNALLTMDKELTENYADIKDLVDQVEKESKASKVDELKRMSNP